MTIDPHPGVATELEPPYANAYEVDVTALLAGDVELPYVSSEVLVQGCQVPLTFTLISGDTVSVKFTKQMPSLKLRVTKIHQLVLIDPDTGMPDSVIADLPPPQIKVWW